MTTEKTFFLQSNLPGVQYSDHGVGQSALGDGEHVFVCSDGVVNGDGPGEHDLVGPFHVVHLQFVKEKSQITKIKQQERTVLQ